MLNLKKLLSFILISISLLSGTEKPSVKLSGWGWLSLGQVKESEFTTSVMGNIDFDERPIGNIQSGIKLTANLLSNSVCKIHIMSSYTFRVINISMGVENAEPLRKSFGFALLEASWKTVWDITDNNSIGLEFGYFPFKYNPEAMNLGEYLFRSNAYPPLLVSGFEIANTKLAGVHGEYQNHSSLGNFKADLFLNIETDFYPTMDLSLTGLFGYRTPGGFFDFSTGISLFHLVPFDKKRITPAKSGSYTTQSVSYINPTTGDTTDYTFRGSKGVARITLDPKVLFKSDIFGKNDLKIYAESALLGIKDYPGWYNRKRERVPIMVGLNLPAFKVLDVLAVEVQYYPMPYQNSFHYMWKINSPVPYFNTYAGIEYNSDWKEKNDDDWKWSVYASKRIRNVRLSGQVASDHTSRANYLSPGRKVYTEMCPRTKDWYYMVRVGFFF